LTLFAQFLPDSKNGLAVVIRSAEAVQLTRALKATIADPKANPEKFGYSKRFIEGFQQSDLFLDEYVHLKHDDEVQYDADDNTLLAVGSTVSGGKEVQDNFDDLTARLAEHVYMSYHEARTASASNTRAAAAHGSPKGKDIDRSLLTLSNMLMVGLFLRYTMTALQLFLRRRLKALIPVLIGKSKKGNVLAVANGMLLDPIKHQEFLKEQLSVLFDQLVIEGP